MVAKANAARGRAAAKPKANAAKPRTLLNTTTGKRYIRRDVKGRFTNDQVNVGPSLAADRRQKAKKTVKPGFGDQGDQKRSRGR